MTTYLKVIWGQTGWTDLKGGSFLITDIPRMFQGDKVIGVTLREKEDVGRVAFIDAGGYILKDLSSHEETVVENDAKYIAVYYTDDYLQGCQQEKFVKGWYYHPCECCVEKFEIPEDELPNDPSWEVKEERNKFYVATPTVLLTMMSRI